MNQSEGIAASQMKIISSSASGLNATNLLASHASTLPFEALPQDVLKMTKCCVLDTLGVSIGASALIPEGQILADYVQELGGKAESTILGFGCKAPAPWAVFANGSVGHMLDFDDVARGGHPSIATIPVAFALGEKQGGISGRNFLTAIAVGMDVMIRLETAITIPQWIMTEGWFPTQLFGFFAATATAGRVLGLNALQMENAFGAAFTQVSGSRQMAVDEATDLRSMQAGFSGQGGILAAELARRGVVGSKEVIEGRYGLYKTYVRDDTPNWDNLIGDLGTRFPLLESHGFKVWPCCSHTRPCTAAVLQLRAEGIQPEDVDTITVIGGSKAIQLLSEPIEAKRCPQVSIDAKYSVPFTCAIAMVTGNVTLRDYVDEGLQNPEVLAMAARVSHRPIPDVENKSLFPIIEIQTKDGTVHKRQVNSVPGDVSEPVGWNEIVEKFRGCVSFANPKMSEANIDAVIDLVGNLEQVEDATEIIRLLSHTEDT
jgi:2-methylcitrate dehydratase PrpD